MTATVRTTCERCGDVELPVVEANLGIPDSGEDTVLEFVCPRCGSQQRQLVNHRGTMLLVRAGVGITVATGPLPSDALPSSSDESR
jgi:Zn finger protein HypA/HybF involved in hydrogenase expression